MYRMSMTRWIDGRQQAMSLCCCMVVRCGASSYASFLTPPLIRLIVKEYLLKAATRNLLVWRIGRAKPDIEIDTTTITTAGRGGGKKPKRRRVKYDPGRKYVAWFEVSPATLALTAPLRMRFVGEVGAEGGVREVECFLSSTYAAVRFNYKYYIIEDMVRNRAVAMLEKSKMRHDPPRWSWPPKWAVLWKSETSIKVWRIPDEFLTSQGSQSDSNSRSCDEGDEEGWQCPPNPAAERRKEREILELVKDQIPPGAPYFPCIPYVTIKHESEIPAIDFRCHSDELLVRGKGGVTVVDLEGSYKAETLVKVRFIPDAGADFFRAPQDCKLWTNEGRRVTIGKLRENDTVWRARYSADTLPGQDCDVDIGGISTVERIDNSHFYACSAERSHTCAATRSVDVYDVNSLLSQYQSGHPPEPEFTLSATAGHWGDCCGLIYHSDVDEKEFSFVDPSCGATFLAFKETKFREEPQQPYPTSQPQPQPQQGNEQTTEAGSEAPRTTPDGSVITKGKIKDSEGTYNGDIVDGQRHGTGTLKYSHSGVYTGQWRSGKRHGQGKYKFPDGSVYEGEWCDDERDGDGRMSHCPDGSCYSGQWRKGMKHGFGTSTEKDGTRYSGEWADDERNGRGALKYNGMKYEGDFKDGLMHGKGVFSSGKGGYAGEWKEGRMEGRGVYRYNDGSMYDGELSDGNRNGFGVFTDASNGTVWSGYWKDDYKEGKGTEKWLDGLVCSGEWTNDSLEGPVVFSYPPSEGVTAFTMTGNFLHDHREGEMTYTWADGSRILKCFWVNDEPDIANHPAAGLTQYHVSPVSANPSSETPTPKDLISAATVESITACTWKVVKIKVSSFFPVLHGGGFMVAPLTGQQFVVQYEDGVLVSKEEWNDTKQNPSPASSAMAPPQETKISCVPKPKAPPPRPLDILRDDHPATNDTTKAAVISAITEAHSSALSGIPSNQQQTEIHSTCAVSTQPTPTATSGDPPLPSTRSELSVAPSEPTPPVPSAAAPPSTTPSVGNRLGSPFEIHTASVTQVCEWLASKGVEEPCLDILRLNKLRGRTLANYTVGQLCALGIVVGDAEFIIEEIKALLSDNNNNKPPTHSTSLQQQQQIQPAERVMRSLVDLNFKCFAFVVGNGAYCQLPLQNTLHDAAQFSQFLERVCKFQVTHLSDVPSLQDFSSHIEKFKTTLKECKKAGNNVASLFFFAGHGRQMKGHNFLMMTGDEIAFTDKNFDIVKFRAPMLGDILDGLKKHSNLVIGILDACRESDDRDEERTRGFGTKKKVDLAKEDFPHGCFVLYPTSPGKLTGDECKLPNRRNHGFFTGCLMEVVEQTKPGTPFNDLVDSIIVMVQTLSSGEQSPWVSKSVGQPFALF
ncbi:membrance occupation and recognition nexus protein 1 [Pelomyxa schiedti]|nr:membrance occupation and recognition nexus protein 1 [Pelomyxa schiedti]